MEESNLPKVEHFLAFKHLIYLTITASLASRQWRKVIKWLCIVKGYFVQIWNSFYQWKYKMSSIIVSRTGTIVRRNKRIIHFLCMIIFQHPLFSSPNYWPHKRPVWSAGRTISMKYIECFRSFISFVLFILDISICF